MPFLALVDDEELELADEQAVREALRAGKISTETWIKDADAESDWQSVEEMFPDLAEGGHE